MKLHIGWRREHGPVVAGIVTLLATAAYLALVEGFELKPILMTGFVALSIVVVVYSICGEPIQQAAVESDETDHVHVPELQSHQSRQTPRE